MCCCFKPLFQALDARRDAARRMVGRFCAANPRVLGLALYGAGSDGSDLDILVGALPRTTLFDLGGLQNALQTLPGVRVGLLTLSNLPFKFRARAVAKARAV